MLTINQIETEALLIRSLLEQHKDEDLRCLTSDFPIGNCRLASYLLSHHILNKHPNEVIYGVSGFSKDNKGISHHWLEVGDIAVDITADQYNLIDDSQLNKTIIKMRPFKPVYVGMVGYIPNYKIFRIGEKDEYSYGFPTFDEGYIEELTLTYNQLMSKQFKHGVLKIG